MFARAVEGETWLTHWKLPQTFTLSPPDGDYRDTLPIRPEFVAEQYKPVVKARLSHSNSGGYLTVWNVFEACVPAATYTVGTS